MDGRMSIQEIFLGNNRYQFIIEGLKFTLALTALATILGIIIGMILALCRLSNVRPFQFLKETPLKKLANFNPLSFFAVVYIDIIRGTPAMVQLMIMYYIVFGAIDAPKLLIAALAFGLNSGAYVAEIIRAGIQGLDKGQMEAARSLGMPYGMTMQFIIIPQAIKNILPTLVSEFIILIKETSIVGVIGGLDLTRAGNKIMGDTGRGVEPLIAIALIYLILTGAFTQVMRTVEGRMRQSD